MCRTPVRIALVLCMVTMVTMPFQPREGGVKQMNDLIMASYAVADISYSLTQSGGGRAP